MFVQARDITIKRFLPRRGAQNSRRLYYYQGNFFYPLEGLDNNERNLCSLGIKNFIKDNKEMIFKDRSHPKYKTKLQLFDEQCSIGELYE